MPWVTARRIFWLASLVPTLAVGVLQKANLLVDASFPFCLIREVSGIPCPGCGMTRALLALADGDFARALHLHPLAPLLVAEVAGLWLVWGATVHGARVHLPRAAWLAVLAGNGAALLSLWAGRLAAGTLPGL